MTALACLRIVIDADRVAAGGDHLAAMVGKVAGAFLETRWRWPRRHGEIAPYAFLLADPRATRLEPAELVELSEELQLKLFGAEGEGMVSLAALEGDQDAVTRFAAVEPVELRRILSEGGVVDGLAGRISQITPEGVRVVSPPNDATPLQPVAAGPVRRAPPELDGDIEASYRAIWFSLKSRFTGNIVYARRKGERTFYSTVDGSGEAPDPGAAAEFDLACLAAAPSVLSSSQGQLFIPVSFSSAIHRGERERYLDAMERLPAAGRSRLTAAVYDVPRAPTFAALNQLKALIDPYFALIDLQTADPNFQIEALALEAVSSVTLALPDVDEGARWAAASRFMANRDAYQRRRIWPAITNVRSRRELEACVKLRVPFLTGRAICDPLTAPAPPHQCAVQHLPLHDGAAASEASRNAVSG